MKYYMISGEASGDLHGSNLIKAIRKTDPGAQIRCWGGERMEAEGGVLVKHYKDLAFMGFTEVIMNIRTIMRNMKFCEKDILAFKPDAIILIDYPGFNLRIARFAHDHGLKVFYYISPQVWAWKKSRVFTIKKVVDRMFVILPFEKAFYATYDIDVDYVGHPLLDIISPVHDQDDRTEFLNRNQLQDKKIIAILPGSRQQEVKRILPEMLKVMPGIDSDYQWVISGVKSLEPDFYHEILKNTSIPVIYGQTYDLLRHTHAAIVTSGTASLETALFKIPQVICYKGSPVSFAIAKRIVNIKYIGLPNLIMDKSVVKELVQSDLTTQNLQDELSELLHNESYRNKIIQDYNELRHILGGPGASERTAVKINQMLSLNG